ncbi:MAG: GGDEF domain-containing protein [Clostridiales bacterium]|nr:GGDEF domain-containing protein [Clostridiales bacterium]
MIDKIGLDNYRFALSQDGGVDIPENILQEWQSILDLLARIEKVKAALIMRKSGEALEVFLSSKTKGNPYKVGQKERYIDSGLNCERVIRQGNMLLVPDASKSPEWMNNPDMKFNMKCYLGFPIKLPNGNIFGTICVLDNKENDFSEDMIECMSRMRDLIESNLLLFHLSITDQLTGVYNRTFFNEKIEKETKNAAQKDQPITAMILDIDNFKNINDTCGHLYGDAVLAKCAGIISDTLRDRDIAFRLGGDEFFVLMPNTAIDEASAVAEKIRANIENSGIGQDIPVTTSIGVAERVCVESLDNWLTRTDKALYKAKIRSGNQVAS